MAREFTLLRRSLSCFRQMRDMVCKRRVTHSASHDATPATGRLQVADLVGGIEALRIAAGMSVDDLVKDLPELRQKIFDERGSRQR